MISTNIRVFDLLDDTRSACFVHCRGKLDFRVDYQRFLNEVNYVASTLISLGVACGDRVLLQMSNRIEWNVYDRAVQLVGAVQVSISVESDTKFVETVMTQTEPVCCFTDSPFCKRRLMKISRDQLLVTQTFDVRIEHQFNQRIKNDDVQKRLNKELSQRMDAVNKHDVASIIYTSGSTSFPKGVVLTHQNLVTAIRTFSRYIKKMKGTKILSLLPLSFMGERKMNYVSQYLGYEIFYPDKKESFVKNYLNVKPEILTVVPFMLNGLLKEFERKKWLPKTIVCGGASIDMQTIQKLNDLGIEVFEVYGLTETTSLLSTNFPENVEFGTVGKPLKELKVKLSEEGEVLTKGSHVARGYFKRSDFPVDEKGWFHTGDLGEMTPTGYLKLVGRLKNKLRLSKGVDVNPEPIEKELRANDNIDNVILFGRNQAALVALFQVNPAMTTAELLPKINDIVYNYNLKCGLNEAIKDFTLTTDVWGTKNGLVMVNGKLNRRALEKKYEHLIVNMYQELR